MKKKIEIVQVLRAYGCLLILMFHLNDGNIIKANYSGFILSMFFIISGYFLASGSCYSTKNYFKKKIIRIVPLYWALTFILFVVQKIEPSIVNNTICTTPMLIKSLLFIPYYSDGVNIFPVLSVGWTLIIEFFVYVVFFVCIKVGNILFKNNCQKALMCSILLYCMTIILGRLCADILDIKSPISFVMNSMYLFSFFIGMGVYYWDLKYGFENLKFKIGKESLIYLAIIWIVFVIFSYFVEFQPILFSGILFFICIVFLREIKIPSIIISLGNMSFSFYLTHKFVVPIASKLAQLLMNHNLGIQSIITVLLSIIITLIASCILYYIFENKLSIFLLHSTRCRETKRYN